MTDAAHRERPRAQYRVTYWRERLAQPQRRTFTSLGAARRHARKVAGYSPTAPSGPVLAIVIEERLVTPWVEVDDDTDTRPRREVVGHSPHEETVTMRHAASDAYAKLIETEAANGVDVFAVDTVTEAPPEPRRRRTVERPPSPAHEFGPGRFEEES